MDFEEKIDALRMNLELAFHDIEAMGVKIDALRAASVSQYETSQVLLKASDSLLKTANNHQDEINGMRRLSRRMAKLIEGQDKRIAVIEGRIQA